MAPTSQDGAQIGEISEFYKHEEYKGTINDIMVVKLKNSFHLSKYVNILRLADAGYDPKGGLCFIFFQIRLFMSHT